ncbi:protein kinase domain-containing protein [Haliangium sp.]|uniref:serine/threonine-protein kinase n=1 Tax=Haliangium sp. TaxID=2663208 RepID=UPI003D0F56F3
MTDSRIGTVLDGRYRIEEELAAGGMGVVYRGERIGLGRGVAIKFLHAHVAAEPSFIKRFEVEAKAMARLVHPNCAAIIDYGLDQGDPYVVMDLVAGESLRALLDDGPLPPPRALAVMRQILAGLAHAHEQGITHRDIKPDNIMIDSAGTFGDRVCILDFGLAKLREGATGLTTGFVIGTPSYMAPEQTLVQPVDERTDIYAAGVVLFEILTGDKPFRADEVAELMRQHREAPVPALADKAPGLVVSPALEAAVRTAMAKQPENRFPSAAEFATALEATPEAAVRPASSPPLAPEASLGVASARSAEASSRARAASGGRAGSGGDGRLGTAPTAPALIPTPSPGPVSAGSPGVPTPEPTAAPPSAPGPGPATRPDPTTHLSGADLMPVPDSQATVAPPSKGPPPALAEPSAATRPASAVVAGARRPGGRRVAAAIAGVLALVVLAALLTNSEEGDATSAPAVAPVSVEAADPARDLAKPSAPAPEEPSATDELAPAGSPATELARARSLLAQDRAEDARRLLQKLKPRHRDTPELHYLLGRAYFATLWCNDGIEAFRTAIELEPSYRGDAVLIESAVYGLANDKHYQAVTRFLVRDIGADAAPALEQMATQYHRKEVRERAARALRRMRR